MLTQVLLSGSGITPMCQLISTSLENPEDKTNWTLFYANKVSHRKRCGCRC